MKKNFRDLYRPLFYMSRKGIKKHIEYLVNYGVRYFGRSRKQSRKNVFSNVNYFLGNPYSNSKKQIRLIHSIVKQLCQ